MKQDLIKLGVALLIFSFFILYSRPFESSNCKRNRFRNDDAFNGAVVEKIRNSKQHAYEIIKLKTGQSFEWEDNYYEKDSFFYKILLGDKLIKKENSLIIEVSRIDTTFTIDLEFPCEE